MTIDDLLPPASWFKEETYILFEDAVKKKKGELFFRFLGEAG